MNVECDLFQKQLEITMGVISELLTARFSVYSTLTEFLRLAIQNKKFMAGFMQKPK